jgi:hypothetical protein
MAICVSIQYRAPLIFLCLNSFSVLEMHAFLVGLMNNFEFTLSVPHEKVRREPCLLMAPTIEGEIEKGIQLPFVITPAPLDN